VIHVDGYRLTNRDELRDLGIQDALDAETPPVVLIEWPERLGVAGPRLDHHLRLAYTDGLGELGGVLLADGPGSFTGLRIGAAFAKGIVRSLGLPLLVAPSLLGAARAALAGDGTVVAEFDALRGDVYRAVYRFSGSDVLVLRPPALAPAGEGIEAFAVRAGSAHASAAALLLLAALRGGCREVADHAGWQPDYGRPAEAEARRLRQHGSP
jgi:tRNA A37 threonylcarbamoyladenosine modification protein TsaB